MLLSWQGYGAIGFAVLAAAVGGGFAADAVRSGAFPLGMGVGFVAGGVAMRLLGKRWNCDAVRHHFCEMRVERWAWVFVPLGLFLVWVGLHSAGVLLR